jgi:hypothetical protein
MSKYIYGPDRLCVPTALISASPTSPNLQRRLLAASMGNYDLVGAGRPLGGLGQNLTKGRAGLSGKP